MRTEEAKDEDGAKTVYCYDERGRLARTTDYDANDTITSDIFYQFDVFDRVSAWRYESPGGVLIKTFERSYDEKGLGEDRQYNAQGQLELYTKEVIDANGCWVTHTFDCNGLFIVALFVKTRKRLFLR